MSTGLFQVSGRRSADLNPRASGSLPGWRRWCDACSLPSWSAVLAGEREPPLCAGEPASSGGNGPTPRRRRPPAGRRIEIARGMAGMRTIIPLRVRASRNLEGLWASNQPFAISPDADHGILDAATAPPIAAVVLRTADV